MKYELLKDQTITTPWGATLFRIRALVAFGSVSKGELGGFIESDKNLAHDGNAWVSGNARVFGNAWVFGDAQVSGNAWVYGDARVSGDAWVSGDARVYGNALVSGNAWVSCSIAIWWTSIVGSSNGTLTAFRCEVGIKVTRGCFIGTLEEFEAKVKETHGASKTAKEYAALIEFLRIRFDEPKKRAKKAKPRGGKK